jgi:polyphosphate glucokinase
MDILGIDVGGSGIKGAVVDTKKGNLLTDRFRIPTPKPATPGSVIKTITEIIEEFNWKGIIGCGFPAAIRHEIIKTASNIDKSWIGINAAKKIKKKSGCPTHLVNDVDAAGFAEMKFGAGKKEKGTVIMAAFGTGIGTAIFTKNKLVPNTELGHLILHNMKAEHYAANIIRENENLSWEDWGYRVNDYLTRLEDLFWPDLFIIGGGVSKKYEEFSKFIEVEARVVPAQARNHAGIIGAALSAKYEHLK